MLPWVAIPDTVTHLLILFLLPFLTYWDAICRGGWVSDDCCQAPPDAPSIARYEGKLQHPINWGSLCKYLRYHLASRPNPNPKWKEEKQPAFVPSPRAHHRLNVWLLSGVAGLAYLAFSHWTSPWVAFLTCVLFIVHPIGTQVVAWVSGINYALGAFWMLLGLNLVLLAQQGAWLSTPLGVVGTLSLYTLCQWMAGESMFQMAGVLVILCWMQAWPFVLMAVFISGWQGLNTFREAVTLRRKTFQDQQMVASTHVHMKKVYVMAKVLYYNVKLSLFPKRLGLYADYYYHYPLPQTEAEDRYFWAGGMTVLGLAGGVLFSPPLVQLGCLWFVAFIAMFSGVLIANQIVVDRYVWLPTLGMCLVVAWSCATFQVLPLYYLLVGIALMRTWSHLYTYEHEEGFYHSNIQNFPKSEIAYGNLGVVQMNQGWLGSCLESWARGLQLNPDYDVCWYNLASAFKSRGPVNPNYFPRLFNAFPKDVLEMAFAKDQSRQHLHLTRYCLQRAVASRVCHFPKQWKEELLAVEHELARSIGQLPQMAALVRPLLVASVT